MRVLLRALVGLVSVYLIAFWIAFMAMPESLYDTLGSAWYANMLVTAIMLSWGSVVLIAWKGYDLFGMKGMTNAFLGGLIVALSIHLGTDTHSQEDLPTILVALGIVGLVLGTSILGIMYSLGVGLPKPMALAQD